MSWVMLLPAWLIVALADVDKLSNCPKNMATPPDLRPGLARQAIIAVKSASRRLAENLSSVPQVCRDAAVVLAGHKGMGLTSSCNW